jgi:hypothetical protein
MGESIVDEGEPQLRGVNFGGGTGGECSDIAGIELWIG